MKTFVTVFVFLGLLLGLANGAAFYMGGSTQPTQYSTVLSQLKTTITTSQVSNKMAIYSSTLEYGLTVSIGYYAGNTDFHYYNYDDLNIGIYGGVGQYNPNAKHPQVPLSVGDVVYWPGGEKNSHFINNFADLSIGGGLLVVNTNPVERVSVNTAPLTNATVQFSNYRPYWAQGTLYQFDDSDGPEMFTDEFDELDEGEWDTMVSGNSSNLYGYYFSTSESTTVEVEADYEIFFLVIYGTVTFTQGANVYTLNPSDSILFSGPVEFEVMGMTQNQVISFNSADASPGLNSPASSVFSFFSVALLVASLFVALRA